MCYSTKSLLRPSGLEYEILSKFSELQNTVLRTTTRGYNKPAVRNLELMAGGKPVDIQIQFKH